MPPLCSIRLRRIAPSLLLGLLVSGPATAAAEVRTGHVDDPDDMANEIDGHNQPDLQQVRATFDRESGTLTLIGVMWEPYTAPKPSNFWHSEFHLHVSQPYAPGACGTTSTTGSTAYMTLMLGSSPSAKASIQGYQGETSIPLNPSADAREFSATFQHSLLAGKDFRCVGGDLSNYFYSSASNPNSRYSSGCDCWYISQTDTPPYSDSGAGPDGWFDGFAPPPPPECSNKKDDDGDGHIDYPLDPDCTAAEDTREAADPPPPPKPLVLTTSSAYRYLSAAIRQELKGSPTRYLRSCPTRLSNTKLRCTVRFRLRHFHRRVEYFSGRAWIWITKKNWYYAFNLTYRHGGRTRHYIVR